VIGTYSYIKYPYIPAHIENPKEKKTLYFIHLPPESKFRFIYSYYYYSLISNELEELYVPKNMKLLAVPLFELYDNSARYGAQLSTIAHLLSRYDFAFDNTDTK
jgi:cleavage and polyadenylation specificity factor subunit 5